MYTIDLLKSNGLPAKSNTKNAATVGFLFSVPIVIFIMMVGSYAQSKMSIEGDRQTLNHYQNRFGNLKSYIAAEELIIERRNVLNESLRDVKDVLDNNIQWTSSLSTIESLLPQTLAMGRMEIKVKAIQTPVPQKKNPKTKINITKYKRILTLYLHSASKIDPDSSVTKFKNNLANSPLLKTQIGDITISSRKPENIDGIDVMSYEMNCTFGGDL